MMVEEGISHEYAGTKQRCVGAVFGGRKAESLRVAWMRRSVVRESILMTYGIRLKYIAKLILFSSAFQGGERRIPSVSSSFSHEI